MGKTTLALSVAAQLPKLKHPKLRNIEIVPEYAREYINKYGLMDHVAEQLLMFHKQLEAETYHPKTVDLILCDSPIFLGYKYATDLHKGDVKSTKLLNELFNNINNLYTFKPHYDLLFHIAPKLEVTSDGTRRMEHLDNNWIITADKSIEGLILNLRQPYKLITSTDLNERVDYCCAEILKLVS